MIHLKYKCKVNFVKLPLIWIYLCLKLVFEMPLPAATQATARLWTARAPGEYQPSHLPRIPRKCRDKLAEYVTPPAMRCGSYEGVYGN